jgi:hypothetical protein
VFQIRRGNGTSKVGPLITRISAQVIVWFGIFQIANDLRDQNGETIGTLRSNRLIQVRKARKFFNHAIGIRLIVLSS